MKHKLIYLLSGILLLAGCASQGRKLKTVSGYEYEIVRKGASTEAIPVNSYVFFNMSLMSGDSVLETTAKMGKPSVLNVMEDNKNYGQLKPLVDLIATLHEGDSLIFYMPLDSFDNKPPMFDSLKGPLKYHVGLVDVMTQTEFEAYSDKMQQEQEAGRQVVRDRLPAIETTTKATYDAYKKGDLASQMQTTPKGVKYIIHEQGDGPKPVRGDQVTVHYYGMLDADARKFDTSFESGQPIQFQVGLGKVIPGWDDALMELNRGTKATLFIPSALAYGAGGSPPVIPENADLIFYVELEK